MGYHVEDLLRAPPALKMPKAHIDMLIEIVTRTPWLYLDEISEELDKRCRVQYLPGYCCSILKCRGYSLQVMRRVARQRDENQRFRYFLALSRIMRRPSRVVFADEVGQDGRGSRRRRGWGEVGAGCDITEFLNRGKHISILALYGIGGFIDFDHKEGGYSAEDFMDSVKFMIIPHLRPYPQDNSIFVLDNCQIHHTYRVALRAMVEAVGAKLPFLAPYCPIDNPIECAFSSFKACWRRHGWWLNGAPPAREDRLLPAFLRLERRGCGGDLAGETEEGARALRNQTGGGGVGPKPPASDSAPAKPPSGHPYQKPPNSNSN